METLEKQADLTQTHAQSLQENIRHLAAEVSELKIITTEYAVSLTW